MAITTIAVLTEDLSIAASSDSEDGDILDLADDGGWEDLEPDVEKVEICCLRCSSVFPDVRLMLHHCKHQHSLDVVNVQKTLSLDLLETIQLVNYIRRETIKANGGPLNLTREAFKEERYLKPVFEDDALLYNLNDIFEESVEDEVALGLNERAELRKTPCREDMRTVMELEKKLQRAQQELDAWKKALREHKLGVGSSGSEEGFEDDDMGPCNLLLSPDQKLASHTERCSGVDSPQNTGRPTTGGNTDSSYFASYSGHEIHETMLKDTVRTDAYRDFIYENKHLFQGKTVLDVGCGTGILSMFCARAGAAKVIAVDNSEIINFARENVYKNGMGHIIFCLRGKIEDVVLPVKYVDIIVSEWMGYCLLYEAMLDSIIWARDRYLVPDAGLMVPSHCTLRLAPMSDSDYVDDYVHHWRNVYGFDMTSMHKNIYDDVIIREVHDFAVPADSSPFLQLSLRTTKTEDLNFTKTPFTCVLTADMESLDGFVIWFDTFFMTGTVFEASESSHAGSQVPAEAKAEDWIRSGGNSIAFTTGPHGRRTHWQQGCLLINYKGKHSEALKKGQVISGTIGYEKREDDNRALDINLRWQMEGSTLKGEQSWSMR